MRVLWVGSPNREKGRHGFRPEAVVIHIMVGTLAGTDALFRDPESKVSSHYGIGSEGQIHQWVGEMDTAWHTGVRHKPTWKLIRPENPNLYTIGIEHEGYENTVWSQAMIDASTRLTGTVCNRWHIPPDRDHIIGHREIYARKTCPGNWIDLNHYVTLVREVVAGQDLYNFIPMPGWVRTQVALNIRKGAPTTAVPVASLVAPGTGLPYIGWTSNGLAVHGNPHWYKDEEGNFFWAGGTEEPIPAL